MILIERSRRVFQIPEIAVAALRDLVLKQAPARAKAGKGGKENNLVFCTPGPMYATDVRMEFKRLTEKAGTGRDWTPRELRHTFVSFLPDYGVPSSRSRTRFESRGKTNGGRN